MLRLASALVALVLLAGLAFGPPSARAQTLGCGGDLAGTLPNCTVSHIGANGRLADNWPLFLKYFGSDSLANSGRIGKVGLMAAGSDTSINLILAPKAGCVIMRVPDGSLTGGQPCGLGSVDLQTQVDLATKGILGQYSISYGFANSITANAIYSFAGGYNCQITGGSANFCWGYLNTLKGQGGILLGRNGNDQQQFNCLEWSPRSWNDIAEGKNQMGFCVLGAAYSDTTSHIMTTDLATYNSIGLNGIRLIAGFSYTLSCIGQTAVVGSSGAIETSQLTLMQIDVPATGTINLMTTAGAQTSVPFAQVIPSTGAAVTITLVKDTVNTVVYLTAQASAAASRRTHARCDVLVLGKT